MFALVTARVPLLGAVAATRRPRRRRPVDPAQIAAGEQLYNNSCISCHGANLQGVAGQGPVADRCRPGRRLLPGLHRPDAGRRERRADAAQGTVLQRRRRSTSSARSSRPTAAGPQVPARAACATTPSSPGRRAVPAELRVLPQLHRPGRRAVPGQVRAEPGRGDRHPDLRGDAVRPGEHAEVLRRPADRRRRRRRSSRSSRTTRRRSIPGGLPLGGFGPAPEGLIAFLVGMGAIIGDHAVDGVTSMSAHPNVEVPSDAELLAAMSTEELARLGARSRRRRAGRVRPALRAGLPGRQAGRAVGRHVVPVAGLRPVLFTVAFIWWPQGYRGAYSDPAVGVRAVHPDPRRHHGSGHRRLRDGRHLAGQEDRSARGRGPATAPGHVGRGGPAHAGRRGGRRRSTHRRQAARGRSRARCCWPAAGSGWSPPCRSSAA